MAKRDFCTLLTEQIIDERKAQKEYRRLLKLFDDERDLLVSGPRTGSWARIGVANMFETDVQQIINDETSHERILEQVRRILCR